MKNVKSLVTAVQKIEAIFWVKSGCIHPKEPCKGLADNMHT
jgi:hypothetical protein